MINPTEALSIICLLIITVFTIRGCYFCCQAFPTDNAGRWITIGELLASVCWLLVAFDGILHYYSTTEVDLLTAIFLVAFAIKAAAAVLKSEYGYKIVNNAYKSYKAQLGRRKA